MKHTAQLHPETVQITVSRGESIGLLILGALLSIGVLYGAIMTAVTAMTRSDDAWLIHFVPAAIAAGMAVACFVLARPHTAPNTKE